MDARVAYDICLKLRDIHVDGRRLEDGHYDLRHGPMLAVGLLKWMLRKATRFVWNFVISTLMGSGSKTDILISATDRCSR